MLKRKYLKSVPKARETPTNKQTNRQTEKAIFVFIV